MDNYTSKLNLKNSQQIFCLLSIKNYMTLSTTEVLSLSIFICVLWFSGVMWSSAFECSTKYITVSVQVE